MLTVKEINPFKEHTEMYNHSKQLYSVTELDSFQGTYQFIQGNISSFKESIFIQGNDIHSGNIYSFKEHIFVQVQGH